MNDKSTMFGLTDLALRDYGDQLTCVVIPSHGCDIGHQANEDESDGPDNPPSCDGGPSGEPGHCTLHTAQHMFKN